MHRIVMICVVGFGLIMIAEMVCKSANRPGDGLTLTREMIQGTVHHTHDVFVDAEPGHMKTPIHAPHEPSIPGEPFWQSIKGGVAGATTIPGFVPRTDPRNVAGSCQGGSFNGGVCGNADACNGPAIDRTKKSG